MPSHHDNSPPQPGDEFFEMQIDTLEAQDDAVPAADQHKEGEEAAAMPTEEEIQALAEEEGLHVEQ